MPYFNIIDAATHVGVQLKKLTNGLTLLDIYTLKQQLRSHKCCKSFIFVAILNQRLITSYIVFKQKEF